MFFSLQADGSRDVSNVEDELFLVLYFDPYANNGKVHVHDIFFTVRQPKVPMLRVCLCSIE